MHRVPLQPVYPASLHRRRRVVHDAGCPSTRRPLTLPFGQQREEEPREEEVAKMHHTEVQLVPLLGACPWAGDEAGVVDEEVEPREARRDLLRRTG